MMNFTRKLLPCLAGTLGICLASCSDLSKPSDTVKADVEAKAAPQGLMTIREQQNHFWE